MAMKAAYLIAAIVAAFIAGQAHGVVNIDDPSAFENIPTECITSGSNLLSFCANEVNKAEEFFGVSIGDTTAFANINLTDELIGDFLEALGEPTKECCRGTCEFNNEFCGCVASMEELIASLAGGDFSFFTTVSEAVGAQCEIPVYYQENCPEEADREAAEKGDCAKFV